MTATSQIDLAELSGDDFWDVEHDQEGALRWSKACFTLQVPPGGHDFVSLAVAGSDRSTSVVIDTPEGPERLELLGQWQVIDIPTRAATRISVTVDAPFQPENDTRLLGVMVRKVLFHSDAERHEVLCQRNANAILNTQEFNQGLETLQSYPPNLRITTSKQCNIANAKACVYCSWDWAKRQEVGSPDFTPEFMAGLGKFMERAQSVNDCSYGEPPLEPHFSSVVEAATRFERRFEFTSNGQTLSARKRRELIDHPAIMTVSVDAATSTGYQRYRDDRFELVLDNLRAFCTEKRERGGAAKVFVSFIVMRSNLEDIPDFLALMAEIGVDQVTFRTLYLEDRLDAKKLQHYGYAFDYDAECLDMRELEAVAKQCRLAQRANNVPIAIEWEAFVNNHGQSAEGAPICTEPWKAFYVLDRGIIPCCYGREAIVSWSDVDTENLETGLKSAFNSKPMQELRRDLREGRLGAYCERALGCPIVKARAKAPSTCRADQ